MATCKRLPIVLASSGGVSLPGDSSGSIFGVGLETLGAFDVDDAEEDFDETSFDSLGAFFGFEQTLDFLGAFELFLFASPSPV